MNRRSHETPLERNIVDDVSILHAERLHSSKFTSG